MRKETNRIVSAVLSSVKKIIRSIIQAKATDWDAARRDQSLPTPGGEIQTVHSMWETLLHPGRQV